MEKMNLMKVMTFQTMIMEYYIPVLFAIGLLFWGFVGLAAIVAGFTTLMAQGMLAGILVTGLGSCFALSGAFFWRLACEIAIVQFKIHSNLLAIRER